MSIQIEDLRERFSMCEDVKISVYPLQKGGSDESAWAVVVYDWMMCDAKSMSDTLLPTISEAWMSSEKNPGPYDPSPLEAQLSLKMIQTDEDSIVKSVFSGLAVLYFPSGNQVFTYNASANLNRSPSDANTEVSIKGARDGFIEDISVNIALIRRRFQSTDLVYKSFEIGKVSKVSIGMVYLKDYVIADAVDEITSKLNNYPGDLPAGPGELVEFLSPYKFSFLPVYDYTGRPDFLQDSLMRGRLALFMDGSPMAIIAPSSLMQFLFSAEDPTLPYYFAIPWRLLRLFSLIIAIFLPGFYIGLMSYHQDQIPFPLLATVSNTRIGLPFPAVVEMAVLLLLLTILKEAGTRMPAPIGSTIAVVSGIIIGDAAIRGGFFSPSVIVIGAMSFVGGATIPNQDVSISIMLFRYVALVLSGTLGMFGFFITVFGLVQYAARHRPYGQPFLAPFSPFSLSKILRNFMRLPGKIKKGGSL